jgi:diguanylate cyclase (GGDEF)-like protein/PAS domain S-box-containing protein
MTMLGTGPGERTTTSADEQREPGALTRVITEEAVQSHFQPIVQLGDTREDDLVVAYEALARGPEGPLASPAALFGAARASGMLAEMDAVCRRAAFRGAARLGLVAPLSVFVNVEPEVLDSAPLEELLALTDSAPGDLQVVLEITERALATRPAELLGTVDRVRELGWGIALDDVGAETASLTFMALLRPDVVKLDLRLVQSRPSPAVAQIMNAVNAYAERSGALILAEGIESEKHLAAARALGARLGQGWLLGRPAASPDRSRAEGRLVLPVRSQDAGRVESPFAALPPRTRLSRSPKRLLVEISKQLEREAMQLGESCIVASTFQHDHHFTPATAQRYRDVVERTGFACVIGEHLPEEPVPGLRGASPAPDDPVLGEWDVVVLSPHFSAALLARDLGDTGPDLDRQFEFALTYDRETVTRAAHGLVSRVVPRLPETAPVRSRPGPPAAVSLAAQGVAATATADALLRRALSAATSGVTIADMTSPDLPLVFVNQAFEELAGHPAEELLGRNCRFLQGPDTDRAAVNRMREAIRSGEGCRETMLNYRGPDREPWWNEIRLSPVKDAAGRLVQYIGVQTDVTARVEAERALRQETDRARRYLARIEELAYTDSLTGLMNRRRFEERTERALLEARRDGTAVVLLFMDLNRFKAVNDLLGHAAGDELLQLLAKRLRGAVRSGDLLARLGGDEFLVALTGQDPDRAAGTAEQVAAKLADVIAEPAVVRGKRVRVSASIGIGIAPEEAEEFGGLLHLADMRMYQLKHPHRS